MGFSSLSQQFGEQTSVDVEVVFPGNAHKIMWFASALQFHLFQKLCRRMCIRGADSMKRRIFQVTAMADMELVVNSADLVSFADKRLLLENRKP